MLCTPHQILLGLSKIKKFETGSACSTYGGNGKCIQGFSRETLGKETTWKTQAQVGRKY